MDAFARSSGVHAYIVSHRQCIYLLSKQRRHLLHPMVLKYAGDFVREDDTTSKARSVVPTMLRNSP